LRAAVVLVDRALRAHRGGAELVQCGEDGEIVLRLTGMCTGCVFWPATVAGTVQPLLEHCLERPVSVSIEGRRVSEAARARLMQLAPPRSLTGHLGASAFPVSAGNSSREADSGRGRGPGVDAPEGRRRLPMII
jgi:Fe-S cluster biogenesis protein NfuA